MHRKRPMLADSAVENHTAAAGDVPWPLLQHGAGAPTTGSPSEDCQSCCVLPGIKTATAMRVVRSVAATNEGCEEL